MSTFYPKPGNTKALVCRCLGFPRGGERNWVVAPGLGQGGTDGMGHLIHTEVAQIPRRAWGGEGVVLACKKVLNVYKGKERKNRK